MGKAVREFTELYGNRDVMLFSVGGRSEVSGNHIPTTTAEKCCAPQSILIL